MYFDPVTLFIAPGSCDTASGELYLDDEHTFANEEGMFAIRKFEMVGGEIRNTVARTVVRPVGKAQTLTASAAFVAPNTVERVVLMGQTKPPKKVELKGQSGPSLSFLFDKEAGTVTIKKPDVRVADDWVISLEY
jgi:hypothetical protein